MNVKKILCACPLVAMMLLGGCATPYQSVGATGGYIDRKIDDQTYYVQFSGNGYTSRDKVHKYFMYRCAELTKQAGFKYFAIIPAALSGAISPENRLARTSGFDHNMMRKVASAPAPIIIYGGGGGMPHWMDSANIRMFDDDAVINFRIVGWDASEVMDQLAPYVHSDGKTPAEIPVGWVFDQGHKKYRTEDLLPTNPTKNVKSPA